MKAYDSVFENKSGEKTTLCVGGDNIAQAARKAQEVVGQYGECIKLELTDKVIL